MILQGLPCAYGVREEFLKARIVNLPKDTLKVRIRLRACDFATIFVKTPNSISKHMMLWDGTSLTLLEPIAANATSRASMEQGKPADKGKAQA